MAPGVARWALFAAIVALLIQPAVSRITNERLPRPRLFPRPLAAGLRSGRRQQAAAPKLTVVAARRPMRAIWTTATSKSDTGDPARPERIRAASTLCRREPDHTMTRSTQAAYSSPASDRLFIGVFPAGLVYADRHKKEHGDYKRVAFLPYKSLVLEPAKGVNRELLRQAAEHAATIIACRGERFQISSCGQCVVLGD